ncbi:MAG: NRDE family protein [Chitinophagaceae bacterium]|nr:NRDE family protein [Chitinophagaceae bacterium]
MCTVTYIPSADGCYLTSSRDEHAARPGAIAPAVYQHNGTVLLYPKDAKANGSWIAFTQTGNAAVLLNGAFVKHIVKPSYRKSRGLIFLDIIAHPQPEFCFMGKNLEGIEPFTIILFYRAAYLKAGGMERKSILYNWMKAVHISGAALLCTARK